MKYIPKSSDEKIKGDQAFLTHQLILMMLMIIKIFEVGKVLGISDSSEDLEAVSEMGNLLSNLAAIKPVHAEELQKNNADLLEGLLENQVLFSRIEPNRQHRSQLLDTVRRLLPLANVIVKRRQSNIQI